MKIQDMENSLEVESIVCYLIDSDINGQPSQVRELLAELQTCEDYTFSWLVGELKEWWQDSDKVCEFIKRYV